MDNTELKPSNNRPIMHHEKYGDLYTDWYLNGQKWSDDLLAVSTIDPELIRNNNAFYIHDIYTPGNWGYINKQKEMVIEPKYMSAYNFSNGRTIVTKGRWEYRKDWSHWNGKTYTGYWFKDEKWGVIDTEDNEIIPCEYDEINYITYEDSKNHKYNLVKVFDAKRGCAVMDAEDGSIVMDWGKYADYSEYSYIDEYGQALVSSGGRFDYDMEQIVGVFNFKTMQEIITPQYGYIEILDENLFQVGEMDDDGNEKNGTIINQDNQQVIDRNDIFHAYKKLKNYEITTLDRQKHIYRPIQKDGKIVELEKVK